MGVKRESEYSVHLNLNLNFLKMNIFKTLTIVKTDCIYAKIYILYSLANILWTVWNLCTLNWTHKRTV